MVFLEGDGGGDVAILENPLVANPDVDVDWRFDLCEGGASNSSAGTFIASLDPFVTDRQLVMNLNRPQSLTGKIASNNELVNSTYGDGLPYLGEGYRTLKAYRFENGEWVIRFAGIIWTLDDEGDENAGYTSFAAFDPWQMLMARMIRRNDGNLKKTVTLANNAAAAVKRHIDKTIEFAGPCYIDTGGFFEPGLVYITAQYEQEYLGRALMEVTDMGVVDVNMIPVDRTDGILVQANALSHMGIDVSGDVAFQYSTGNHQAKNWARHLDMSTVANQITNFNGTKKKFSFQEDTDSQDLYGVYEDCRVLTDIVHQDFLDALTTGELAERKSARENVAVLPMPTTSAEPFRYWGLGDLVTVECSDDARQAVSGVQRIYGFTLDIDDDGVERVSELRVTPDLG
jgi:hypothetical protein